MADVTETCESLGGGPVTNLVLPRAADAGPNAAAVGKIFVKFETQSAAAAAGAALCKKCFNGKRIAASYFDEVRYDARELV